MQLSSLLPQPYFYWHTWAFFAFYIPVELLSRLIANTLYTTNSKLDVKRRDIYGRWPPSWVHAVASTAMAFFPFGIDEEVLGLAWGKWLMANTVAYFTADMVVDRDPEYILHHLAPILHVDFLLRSGATLENTRWFLCACEAGNVIAHSWSLLSLRSGKLFHAVNTISFWVSRPISFIFAYKVWMVDLPVETRFTPIGFALLASILATVLINARWMVKMLLPKPKRNRAPSDAAAASAGAAVVAAPSAAAATATNGNGHAAAAAEVASPSAKERKKKGVPQAVDAKAPQPQTKKAA